MIFKLTAIGDPPPLLIGDSFRLNQVLNNVVSNAAKFTEKGEIELKVQATTFPSRQETFVAFSVRDTGIGMDAETLSHLFRPFMQADSTTTRRFGGTGLPGIQ